MTNTKKWLYNSAKFGTIFHSKFRLLETVKRDRQRKQVVIDLAIAFRKFEHSVEYTFEPLSGSLRPQDNGRSEFGGMRAPSFAQLFLMRAAAFCKSIAMPKRVNEADCNLIQSP